MRKALFVVALAAALWLAPGALAAGWCGDRRVGGRPPGHRHGRAGARDRRDAVRLARPVRRRREPAPGRRRLDERLVDGPGPDPRAALRPGDVPGRHLPRHLVRAPAAARERLRGRLVASARSRTRSARPASRTRSRTTSSTTTGRPSLADVCGTGGGDFNQGDGLAIVWLNGCPDVPSDGIQAHELLHAFGALPAGAPNACTPATDPAGEADSGHPCDSPSDVLYPFADGRPLQQQVLDFNHDDYYAHSGTQNDIQDAIFLHHLNTPEEALGALHLRPRPRDERPARRRLHGRRARTQWDQGTTVTLLADSDVRPHGSSTGRAAASAAPTACST